MKKSALFTLQGFAPDAAPAAAEVDDVD